MSVIKIHLTRGMVAELLGRTLAAWKGKRIQKAIEIGCRDLPDGLTLAIDQKNVLEWLQVVADPKNGWPIPKPAKATVNDLRRQCSPGCQEALSQALVVAFGPDATGSVKLAALISRLEKLPAETLPMTPGSGRLRIIPGAPEESPEPAPEPAHAADNLALAR